MHSLAKHSTKMRKKIKTPQRMEQREWLTDKQRQFIRTNQVLQPLLATLKWHMVTGSLLCQIALWDFLGTNLVAIIFLRTLLEGNHETFLILIFHNAQVA